MGRRRRELDDELKERFVDACKRKLSISNICKELGISRSTAYDWREKWLRLGDGWNKQKSRRRYSFTARAGLEWNPILIERLALLHPERGCDKLAQILGTFGIQVTAPTVQAILTELGLGTINDRTTRLEAMWRNQGKPDSVWLSQGQEEYLLQRWLHDEERKSIDRPIGKQPGDNLVHGWFEGGAQLSGLVANVIVDGFDGKIFCRLGDECDDGLVDSMRMVIQEFSKQGGRIKRIYTDRSSKFGFDSLNSKYAAVLKKTSIEHVIIRPRGIGRKLQWRACKAWDFIRNGFLVPNWPRFYDTRMSIADIEDELSEWLDQRYKYASVGNSSVGKSDALHTHEREE